MVKVSKIAVWKIGDRLVEDAATAERCVREIVVGELLRETNQKPTFEPMQIDQVATWVAFHHNMIEQRVKSAMAGS